MTGDGSNGRVAQAIGAAIFAVLTVVTAAVFLRVFAPRSYVPPTAGAPSYDRTAMQQALTREAVRDQLAAIEQCGSRSPGQPGHAACGRLIAERYAQAGLEVFEQELDAAYPVCSEARLTGDGAPLEVALWPAPPNHVQPMTTPESGLQGELMLITEESVRAAGRFDDQIALVDLARPLFKELGINPARFADLGFKALIVGHSGGFEQIPWRNLKSLRLGLPLNYVRLIADERIFAYAGRRVRLDVRTAYTNVPVRNIVGVLHGPRAARGAVIISAAYDGFTALPDLASGSVQALQLALQLRLLDGLAPHRETLQRDVIWVSCGSDYMAQNSLNQLLSAIGRPGEAAVAKARLDADLREQTEKAGALTSVVALFSDERFGREAGPSGTALDGIDAEARLIFDEEFRTVLRQRVFDAGERLLQAQIAFEHNPKDLTGPAYRAFRAAKQDFDRLNTASALPVRRFLERPSDGYDLRAALLARFQVLRGYHDTRVRRLRQELALNALMAGYDEVLVLAPSLNPAAVQPKREILSFSGGSGIPHAEAADAFRRLLQEAVFTLGLQDRVSIDFRGARHGDAMAAFLSDLPLQSQPWSVMSYPAFALISPRNDYAHFISPVPSPLITNLTSLAGSLQVLGEATLSAAHGAGRFPALQRNSTYATRGTVYAAGIGNAVVPNFSVAGALVFAKAEAGPAPLGFQRRPIFFADPYGHFDHPVMTMPFPNWADTFIPEAAHYGPGGTIDYYKDSGLTAQNIYKSDILPGDGSPVNLILYRGTAVSILNRVNPQTMRSFTGAAFLRPSGLTPFASTAKIVNDDGICDFIDPKARFFVTLKAGSPDNEQVAETRAFCLNTRAPGFVPDPAIEIDGPGYLAQDTPVVREIAAESASSMALLAAKRIRLQEPYGMVDEMTTAFQERSLQLAAEAGRADRPALTRLGEFRQAMTYLILNHPVIRGSIAEAIWGILWYMGLLVPFVFFFEKLMFGFTDIRKQLLAEGVIFLVVFGLLWFLHPAFKMIRSSVMILLGFVIILISGGITLLLSSKFRENLDALKRLQGSVKGAEVNKAGILMTAFMLGLNNMHRRKVRTGLTCATLVLMTFVMICFTSVRSNIVDQEKALSKAAYQGLLVKEARFKPIAASEISALDSRFGEMFTVNERVALVGRRDWNLAQLVPPEVEVAVGEAPEISRQTAKSVLLLRQTEPLRASLRLLTTNGWFSAAQAAQTQGPYPVLLPDTMAENLGLTVAAVDTGSVKVRINGVVFAVHGVFESSSLSQAGDLDGDNLLPFDTEGLVNPEISDSQVLAEREDPRVAAGQTVIALVDAFPVQVNGAWRTLSVAVDMGQTGFASAKREIATYLEQTGRETCYGLDGTAYIGRRARAKAVGGLADLLIPLIIAALTVLNTMKGSVYERRDEIFVYNAVGIAPRYVFFMFIAEALVYAVVGAVLGYLLSQGTGRVLTAMGWTGGLNMNFTSLSTVYASLAIAAATLLSTYFPAKSAMEIAKPAEKAGWELPPAEADEMTFALPFTFTHFDRIAVMGFFHQYFVNHGEGSAGPFFASEPRLTLCDRRDPLADDGYIPSIEVPVWLKPFDLGVSQRIVIELATDADTGEYIATMRLLRLTGTKEAWLRLNAPLVSRIRRHFLHWRAVSDDLKQEFHGRARELLEAHVAEGGRLHG
jgi:hypothetical protein